MTTYTFKTSQPLTQYQLDFLNEQLNNLPSKDWEDFLDVPEFTTLIEISE